MTASREIIFIVLVLLSSYYSNFPFRDPVQLHGALINGLETRVSRIESQLSDLDARDSEEHDYLANERELHHFILTGELGILCFRPNFVIFKISLFAHCITMLVVCYVFDNNLDS